MNVKRSVKNVWVNLDPGLKQWLVLGASIAASIALPGIGGVLVSCLIDGTFVDMFKAITTGDWETLALCSLAFVPGAGALKALKGLKAVGGIQKASKVIAPYKVLSKTAAKEGKQAHKLIEKRLVPGLQSSKPIKVGDIPSASLTKGAGGEHNLYTQRWKKEIPYGTNYAFLTRDEIADAARKVYYDAPDLLGGISRLARRAVIVVRTQSRVNFILDSFEEARRILEPLGFRPDTRPGINIHSATLFTDQPEYKQLTEALTRHGIHYTELKELSFSEEELANAQFLEMHPAGYWGYPQPEDGFKDESYEKPGHCPACGRGLLQNRPFLVRGPPRLGRNDILAMNWTFEFIITQNLRDWIVRHKLSGADFWPLLDYRTRKPIKGFYQLHVEHQLPAMSTTTEFETVEDTNPRKCQHPVLNLRLHQMRYLREDLEEAKDFNRTCEWLGGGWFGQTQWKVVSAKVYQLFEKHGIKKVKFRPVIIEE